MKKVVIIGNSILANMLGKYVQEDTDWQIMAYSVNSIYRKEKYLNNTPVIELENLNKHFSPDEIELLLGIGYRKMHKIRQKVYLSCKEMGFSFTTYVHSSAIISKYAVLGEGNIILERVIMEPGVRLGNANLLYGGVILGHDSQIENYCTFSINAVTAGSVHVCSNCFIGIGATLQDGIELGKSALIGGGSYVSKNICPNQVLVPPKSYVLEGRNSNQYFM